MKEANVYLVKFEQRFNRGESEDLGLAEMNGATLRAEVVRLRLRLRAREMQLEMARLEVPTPHEPAPGPSASPSLVVEGREGETK